MRFLGSRRALLNGITSLFFNAKGLSNKTLYYLPLSLTGGANTITSTDHRTYTLSGAITGTGSLTISANVILSGASTNSGALTIASGYKVSNTYDNGGNSGLKYLPSVTVQSGATYDFKGIGDAFQPAWNISGTGVGGSGAITNTGVGFNTSTATIANLALNANSTINSGNNWYMINTSYGATTINLNAYTLTVSGNGYFGMSNGTISGTGAVSITGGTFALGISGAGTTGVTATAIPFVVANAASAAAATIAVAYNSAIGSLSGGGTTGGAVSIASGAALTIGGDNTSKSHLAGIIGPGALVKTGTGTQQITGALTNTALSSITVNGGTLQLANGVAYSNLCTGTININGASNFYTAYAMYLNVLNVVFNSTGGGTFGPGGNTLLNGNTTITTNGGAQNTVNGAFNLYTSGQTLAINTSVRGTGATDLLWSCAATNGSPTCTKSGPGILTLTNSLTYASMAVTAGTFQIGTSSSAPTIPTGTLAISSGATVAFGTNSTSNISYSGAISGAGSITLAGTSGGTIGTYTLQSTAGFSGTLALSLCRLVMTGTFGSAGQTITVPSGSGVYVTTGANVTNPFSIAGTGWDTYGAIRNDGGTLSGTVALTAAATIGQQAASTGVFSNTFTGAYALTVSIVTGGLITFSGNTSALASIAVGGAGTTAITGTSTAVTVASGAILSGGSVTTGTTAGLTFSAAASV